MGKLDASGFASAARVDLRFHYDDIRFKALRTFASFFFGEGDFAPRSGNTVAGEDSFSLVFVNLHQ